MGGLECVITGLMDEFNHFFKKKKLSREVFTFFVITASFCVAMINVTPVSFQSEEVLPYIIFTSKLWKFSRFKYLK